MSVVADRGDGELTLAFELAAIETFADPAAVFADAAAWSQHVGVVANDTEAVAAFVEDHGLQQDFDLGERDKWLAMEGIREAADTDRYVFVGASPEDQRLADHLGWEYHTPPEVAEAAGWEHGSDDSTADDGGLLSRVRGAVWPF